MAVELRKIDTEQRNPRTMHIDTLSTLEMVKLINDEDHRVAEAVAQVLPEIARAVDIIYEQLRQGGRLFYCGAGTSGRLGVLDAVECPPTYGVSPELVVGLIAGGDSAFVRAKEGAEDNRALGRQDLMDRNFSARDVLVGIAASGRTPYVLGAMDYAHEVGGAGPHLLPRQRAFPPRGRDHGAHSRARGGHRLLPDEERHRPENGAEHALHGDHD